MTRVGLPVRVLGRVVGRLVARVSAQLSGARISFALCVAALWLTALWSLSGHADRIALAALADMDAMARGELWRLATGPLVHATWDHLLWDGALLLVLALFYERRLRDIWPWLAALGLVVPTLAVWLSQPDAGAYFGLSGLTYALMAAILVHELGADRTRWYVWALGIALCLKVGRDTITTSDIFVSTELGSNVDKAPEAHLVGVLVGVFVVLVRAGLRKSGVIGRTTRCVDVVARTR